MSIALRALTLFLFIAPLGVAVAAEFDSLRTERRDGQYMVVHQVEQKETLFSLARRYGASVAEIRSTNDLSGNGIEIDQLLYVPIGPVDGIGTLAEQPSEPKPVGATAPAEEGIHRVQPKETLFAISRKYGVTVDDLRDWNDLSDNAIDIGQELRVTQLHSGEPRASDVPGGTAPKILVPVVPVGSDESNEPPTIAKKTSIEPKKAGSEDLRPKYYHYVQAGETLRSISRKYKTKVDSLLAWNDLATDRLSIGQKVAIRKKVRRKDLVHRSDNFKKTQYGSKMWVEQDSTGVFVVEEGIAGVIDGDVSTTRYLALHRNLPVGSEMRVVNLMNHREIKVKVVGKLPETGLNRKVMVRLTSNSFKDLGIIDPKSRVELSYVAVN
ncbi:MAG: LysM peptidoglycan-binding domain-containing protein [Bacteroidota bacterium]